MSKQPPKTSPRGAPRSRRPILDVVGGPYLLLVWHSTVGVQSREIEDMSVFDVPGILDPSAYPAFRLAADSNPTTLRRVLKLARENDACTLCRSPRARSPRTHGALERVYELPEKRTARTRVYRDVCIRCHRYWEVTLAGERTQRCRQVLVEPCAQRHFSVVVRSGGTQFDCVEHEDLVVDARGVRYTFRPDAGEPEETDLPHEAFLDPSCRLRAAFPEQLASIDQEIELVRRYLSSRALAAGSEA